MGDVGVQTIYTYDEVIRSRALDEDQVPLVAYPKSKLGIADYEFFTGKQLDRLVDGAAKALIKSGLRSLVRLSFHPQIFTPYPQWIVIDE